VVEPITHPRPEVLQPPDDKPQLGLRGRHLLLPLRLQPRDPFLEAGETRLELALLQIAVGVGIDQPGNALARLANLF
jgi:hypothetical protein